ncbi:carbohydrate ABC transporter permease [Actinopolymorpha pittospori]|uniref:ABC-type glycerol-3-phosphate transport system permease component n=1 Tax=Actinopolymorpha pittospori TaxID=648752 RepID=A0A927RAX6_9ACTN|nr:carbohydrate ABC transporter permease [Actinopolymorpha pittospori]MBE1609512.1 ABC-type glycerol-3-phosphate transport system permease component [Actinopolymorpha pittospori]
MGLLYLRFGQSTLYYVIMAVLAVAFLLPLIWMLCSSLKPEADVLSIPPTFIPTNPEWTNYAQVFDRIPIFLFNSVKLAALNVVGILIVASLAGYAFGRLEFAGRDAAFMVLLATSIIPGIAYLIPQYIVFRQMGWVDTHYPLWVPRVLTPVFGTFLMRQSFMTIPKELEDAAKIDGASTFTTFWRIMLPQTKPALAAIGVFTFLESWNDLFGPLIFLNSEDLQTLPVALAQFQSEYFTQVSQMMAGATVAVVPVIIVFLFAQRYFIQGITMTGLKG